MKKSRDRKDDIREAIVNKVDAVLKNAEHITLCEIMIKADANEVPQICYHITENIIPECPTAEYDPSV